MQRLFLTQTLDPTETYGSLPGPKKGAKKEPRALKARAKNCQGPLLNHSFGVQVVFNGSCCWGGDRSHCRLAQGTAAVWVLVWGAR